MMPAIGHVRKQANGSFTGQILTLTITADVAIVPNRATSNNAQPHYRVMAGKVEIGAGWVRRGEVSGKEYLSLSLATPEFGPRRLYANLARIAGQDDDDMFAIIWSPAD